MTLFRDGICRAETGECMIGTPAEMRAMLAGLDAVESALERGRISEAEDELDARENQDGPTDGSDGTGAPHDAA